MRLRRVDSGRFDLEGAGDESASVFGLPYAEDECSLVLLPVPWEVTTSYGRGTAKGPEAMRSASPQLDLFDPEFAELGLGRPWAYGIHMRRSTAEIETRNAQASDLAAPIIARGGDVGDDPELVRARDEVNAACRWLDTEVEHRVAELLANGHGVGVVGGDHAVAFGAIAAHARQYPGLGILHIDAHADLRVAYEGFERSHASIMHNVLERIDGIGRLVQVGIRDLSEGEYERSRSDPRVRTVFDYALRNGRHEGLPWAKQCARIVDELPAQVYVSFDIDGLDPVACPHTGTPVPGGLAFAEALTLLQTVVSSGRTVVGFDLVEVAPGSDEWDGNVGARLLYRLCSLVLFSAGARD